MYIEGPVKTFFSESFLISLLITCMARCQIGISDPVTDLLTGLLTRFVMSGQFRPLAMFTENILTSFVPKIRNDVVSAKWFIKFE